MSAAGEGGPVRIAIFGAGAIGSVLGGYVAAAGRDVVLVGRGAHFEAMGARGLALIAPDGRRTETPVATAADSAAAGVADIVIFTVKSQQLAAAAAAAAPMIGPDTTVVVAVNGIPWWYFNEHGGPLDGLVLDSVDPGGLIARSLPVSRTVGCVISCSAELVEPGTILHRRPPQFALGAASRAAQDRTDAVARALDGGGIEARVADDIRSEIWLKLWGNAVVNPVTAMSGMTAWRAIRGPELSGIMLELFREVEAVFGALGIVSDSTPETRRERAGGIRGHRNSMMQDAQAGRELEIDGIAGAVVEIAARLGVPVPRLETVAGLARARNAALRGDG